MRQLMRGDYCSSTLFSRVVGILEGNSKSKGNGQGKGKDGKGKGKNLDNIQCQGCGKWVHLACDWPDKAIKAVDDGDWGQSYNPNSVTRMVAYSRFTGYGKTNWSDMNAHNEQNIKQHQTPEVQNQTSFQAESKRLSAKQPSSKSPDACRIAMIFVNTSKQTHGIR